MCATELVLVIGNEFRTRQQVCDQLERADFRVLAAEDTEVGLNMIRRESPDLLVVDASTSFNNNWNLTQRIRLEPQLASLPILMMTPARSGKPFAESLDLYADDFVSKPLRPHELVRHVKALINWKKGKSHQPKRITCGEIVLDLAGHQLSVRNECIDLSPAQFRLLSILMQKQGQVVNRRELLLGALGYSEEGNGRTLDTHIRNLRQKIEFDPERPEYIHTVVGSGYCLRRLSDPPAYS
jgi:DNA-binding response OmpR family regulator